MEKETNKHKPFHVLAGCAGYALLEPEKVANKLYHI